MSWFESEGGPIIGLEPQCLHSWTGVDGDDYREVSKTPSGYLFSFEFDSLTGIALWGEPLPVMFSICENVNIIIRRRWLNNPNCLGNICDKLKSLHELNVAYVRLSGASLVFFDAAYSGGAAAILCDGKLVKDERLPRLQMKSHTVRLETFELETEEFSGVIHKLVDS